MTAGMIEAKWGGKAGIVNEVDKVMGPYMHRACADDALRAIKRVDKARGL